MSHVSALPTPSDRPVWPAHGRLAGVDFGTVRIGIATTDADRTLASPCETYAVRSPTADAEYFRRLVRQERIVGFVVGLPVHTHGGESQKSVQARQFGAWLAGVTDLPVEYFDERFTTQDAEALLMAAGLTKKQRRARLDRLAAQIMLTTYLQSRLKGTAPPGAIDD